MYERFFKRILDLFLSCTALFCLASVFLTVAVLVYVSMGSPVIYSQERPGKNEILFKIYKFRTMTEQRDEKGSLLPDCDRLTKMGIFLRDTSLDELPELWNIVRGDMSFVGPRPLLVKYLPFYREQEKKRHSVRPGLSGLAQINGRNALTWEQRFAYDNEYIANITFAQDIRIIWKTIVKTIEKADVGECGLDNIPDFDDFRKAVRVREVSSYADRAYNRRITKVG